MKLTTSQVSELMHSKLGIGIGSGTYGKCDECFVGVKSGVTVAEVVNLKVLNRLNYGWRNKMNRIFNSGKSLESIEKQCHRCPQKL